MRRYLTFLTLFVGLSCSSRTEDDTQAKSDAIVEFDSFVDQNNACTTDGDCAVFSPGCPLGCWVAVTETRLEAAKAKARELIEEVENHGSSCQYVCRSPSSTRCEAQHCEIDFTSPTDGCTQIGCGSAFQVSFDKVSPWVAGDYRVLVGLDGTDVDCTATLPLDCNAPFPCNDPNVLLLLSGCALPASEHSLGGIEIVTGNPATVSIEFFYQGQSLAVDEWAPIYSTSRPNGPECEPECNTAPSETMLIP